MTRKNRLFITFLLLLTLSTGLYGIHIFSKSKMPREAINVVGRGEVIKPADFIQINGNFYFSNQSGNNQTEKFEQEIDAVKKYIEEQGFTFDVHNIRTQKHCYLAEKDESLENCTRTEFNSIYTGENLLKNGKLVYNFLKKKPYREISNTELGVSNIKDTITQALTQALSNGKQRAELTAVTLGAKLGRVLQTTEYRTEEGYYEDNAEERKEYRSRFYEGFPNESDLDIKIHRTVYLTFDID